jgi:hypothetical protein
VTEVPEGYKLVTWWYMGLRLDPNDLSLDDQFIGADNVVHRFMKNKRDAPFVIGYPYEVLVTDDDKQARLNSAQRIMGEPKHPSANQWWVDEISAKGTVSALATEKRLAKENPLQDILDILQQYYQKASYATRPAFLSYITNRITHQPRPRS